MKPGKIHILGDALYSAPQAEDGPIANNVQVPHIKFSDAMHGYDGDQFIDSVSRALRRERPCRSTERFKLKTEIAISPKCGIFIVEW